MEIINELIIKWKKTSLKQKIIMISVGMLIIFLLFFNRDFFSQNEIENKGNIGKDNTIDKMKNSGKVNDMIKNINNNGDGDIVLGDKKNETNIYGDEEELEKFIIKVQNLSYANLTEAILYEGKDCLKKIEWDNDGYDNIREEYTFHIMIKKNRKKKMSIKQQNYLCKNFVIEQSNRKNIKIRLKIDCNIEPQNNECLVREE